MKIYLCARFRRQAEMRLLRTLLKQQGHEITAEWLDEKYNIYDTIQDSDERAEIAYRDWHNIKSSDVVAVFTSGGQTTHGDRFVEHGIAMGLGREVWVIGPAENLFQELADEHFATIEDFLIFTALCEMYLE